MIEVSILLSSIKSYTIEELFDRLDRFQYYLVLLKGEKNSRSRLINNVSILLSSIKSEIDFCNSLHLRSFNTT